MRNLKRALSLGLTAAMISGLMVMGSSAASYADVTSEQNQEAIEVLQAVGIMVGDENGNFNPDAQVTRNEMAVIMSNLMDYRVATYSGTSPFTDVPSWAEPYVAACWTNGITAGYSATTYGGSDTVTTAQAALMLMKALGYFQYDSDFGTDWQLATITQATKIDLFTDVDSGVREAMTRNDLAQLVLNTLESGTVEAESDGSFQVGDVTFASSVSYKFVTSGRDYATAINDRLATYTDGTYSTGAIVELGEKLYQGDLTKVEDYDVFGRPADIWEYQADEIGTFAKDADYTFTAKVTSKALYETVGRTAADNYTWNVSINGEEVDYTGRDLSDNRSDDNDCFLDYENVTLPDPANDTYTGNGVVTEVYVDGTDKTVDVAIINYYAAEVLKVEEADETITLSALYGPARTSDLYDTTDFVEDQIVMYSYANGEIQEVYAAEEMSGEVTRVRSNTTSNPTGGTERDGDYFIVDGTTYKYNATMTAADRLVTDNVNNDVVAYVDANGYVAYIDESAITYDYAYVLSMGTGGDDYDSHTGKGDTVYARLVLSDGTMVSVETDEDNDSTLLNHLVSYSVDKNDVYSLTDRSYAPIVGDSDLEIQNGVASMSIDFRSNSRYTANSNTVFVIAESDPDKFSDYTFSVYTGVRNVPDIDGRTGTEVVVATENSNSTVARVVYIEDADVSGTGNVIFAKASPSNKLVDDSEIGDYYEVPAVVDGEVVTLEVKDNTSAADVLVKNVASTEIVALKSITENSDGLITSVRTYGAYTNVNGDGYLTGMGTGKAERDTVRLDNIDQSAQTGGDSIRYAWDEEVEVVLYDYKGDFSVSRISAIKNDSNDGYVAVMDGDVILGICIQEVRGGEGEDSETITQGDVSYTPSVSSRGNGTIVFNVERPEYVPAGATVTISGDLYVNGVDDGTAITATVNANDDSVRYTTGLSGFDPDDELTVENLKVTYEKVTVRYLDGDNNSREIADSMFVGTPTEELNVGTPAGDVKFTLDTNTTTVPDLEYTVTGLASGDVTTRTDLPAANNAEQTVVSSKQAKGDNYVTVTIYGLGNLAANETYTISNGVNVNGDPMAQLVNGTGTSLQNLDANLAGNNDKLTITATKYTGIAANEKVGVTLTMNGVAATDVKGYTITVKLGDETITGKFETGSLTCRGEITVEDNIVVNASDITIVPTYNLTESHTLSTDGKTLTVTFNQAIDKATATKDTITFTDSSAGTATVDSVSVSADGKVLTITAADSFDAFATGDTFDLSGVKAADKTFGNLALTSPGTITLA